MFNAGFDSDDFGNCFKLLSLIYSLLLENSENVKIFNNRLFLERLLKLHYSTGDINTFTLMLNIGRITYKYDTY